MDKENLKAALGKLKRISGGKTYYAGNDIFEVLSLIFGSYKNKYIKVRELFDELHEIGYGFVLFFAGLIGAFIPMLGGFLPIFFGAQMVIGRESPWIPAFISDKKINIHAVREKFQNHKSKFDYINRFVKHRYEFFTSKLGERIIGSIIVFCGLSILIPLPGTNFFPGLAIMFISIGYLAKDGIVITTSLIIGVISSLFGMGIAAATLFAILKGFESL